MSVIRAVIMTLAVIVGTVSLSVAQSNPINPGIREQRASAESVATPDKGTVPATAPKSETETLKPTVEQEIEALKNRISELENEVRQARRRWVVAPVAGCRRI